MMKHKFVFATPWGMMTVEEEDGALTRLGWGGEAVGGDDSALLRRTECELNAYLRGELRQFTLPTAPAGTPFQRSVWRELLTIPYGAVASYGRIAQLLDRPGAARAVGMACHCNPIAIVIPCHRVVGADGTLTGYAGGLELKRRLLELETAIG
ncbi:Methylated-DNA--protein-cysteine methyltransferase [bioreactor metagenome]|uniref:methylated-DNA--[protein]-cysteine S-methyltransferase n=1 Tax=bioreactor metagenome TaxID=1076179 RepID=A0A645CBZ4_9ZZZZ